MTNTAVEINLTPSGVALIDIDDFEKVSIYQWRMDKSHGYVYTNIAEPGKRLRKTYLHRYIMNPPKGMVVDHINRNKADNRKENLQIVTQAENASYQKRSPHPISGYIGVRPSKTGAKWRASLMVAGREQYVGRFNSRHEAALAYNEAALACLGDRADLNKIYIPKIALIGKARSGKSSIARYLVEQHGFTRYAFGDELKRLAHEVFDIDASSNKDRGLYQFFGQVCRERDEDVWLRKVFRKIERENPDSILVEDVRQPNEYHALKAAGYTLIRVEAPEALRIHRAIESGDTFNLRDLTHDTETALDGFAADFTVVNDAGLPELYAQIDAIMDLLRSSSGGEVA